MTEIWKAIPGYEGYYEVSNTGKVRSLTRYAQREDRRIQRYKGKELAPGKNENGYRIVDLSKEGIHKSHRVHQLVALCFLPPQPAPTYQVNHKNGDKDNNGKDNLEWLSVSDNLKHAVRTGLRKKFTGGRRKRVKTLAIIQEIIKLHSQGKTNTFIAAQLGVSTTLVYGTISRHKKLGGK